MRTFQRFLSAFTIFAMMSGPALVAAQTTDNQEQYDSSADTQPLPEDNQASQPEPQYDQPQASANDEQAGIPETNERSPNDPPARAARLQFATGSISVQPHGAGDWVTGELNRPLTNSDNIWADKDSRAELNVGTGLIRLGSESSLTLTNIDENTVQLQLHQGAMNLHVRRLYDNERYEVDTPNQAFTVLKPGDYRFDVDPDSDKTVVTVWRGEGDSTGDGPAVHIHGNEQARFSNGTSMTVDVHNAPAEDGFDQWARLRDERLDHSASSKYVSPDVVGYEDLDEYGSWKNTEQYGSVWYPSVEPGWAPYHSGHWIWDDPWGWSWVDYEPWGYAPFHYGRWVNAGGFWGWAPGPIYARPYYAPALVAWFGGGWGVGVGFGGGFGWCPLGWGEPFIPWYGASRGYFTRVNITNTHITNITNIYNNNFRNGRFVANNNYRLNYANMRARGGFTAVSRNTLVNSLPVAHNNLRISQRDMNRLTPVHSPGVTPTRASMMGSSGARAVPPQRAFSRPVVSRLASPNRGSFNAGARAGLDARAGSNVRGGFNGRAGSNGNVARPGQTTGADRSIGGSNRGPVFNNSRPMPNAGNNPRPMPNAGARSVPRPGSADGGVTGRPAGNFGARGMSAGPTNGRMPAPEMSSRNNVPRPNMGRSEPSSSQRGGSPNYSPRGGSPSYSPRGGTPSYSPRGGSAVPQGSAPRGGDHTGPRGAVSVPRPSPEFSASNRGGDSYGRQSYGSQSYGSQSYGRSVPSAGGVRPSSVPRPSPSFGTNNRSGESYSRPSQGGSYGRSVPSYDRGASSRPTPSYGGSYGRPSASPSYGGSYGRSSPAPSYGGGSYGRSMPSPSYGGARAPSYGGGGFGGGRPSGGFNGGRSSGGGGGFGGGSHASSGGGGGGHASAGGGGGGHSGGGGGHGGHR